MLHMGDAQAPSSAAPLPTPAPQDFTDIAVAAESELCIFVPFGEKGASLAVVRPPHSSRHNAAEEPFDAEVFGSPLADGMSYPLAEGASFAVWSWLGCTIRLRGSSTFRATGAYRAPASNYKAVAEYHTILQRYREEAAAAAARDNSSSHRDEVGTAPPHLIGPRVIICGPRASGRHSVARTLANFAVRQPAGWAPTFVDLDPRHPTVGLPGCVSVTAWEYTSTLDEDVVHLPHSLFWVGSTSATVPTHADGSSSGFAPLSTVFGLTAASVLRVTTARLTSHQGSAVGWSGAIIVLPWVPDPEECAKLVHSTVNAVDATHVLCVGDDELAVAVSRRLGTAAGHPSSSDPPGFFTTVRHTPLQLRTVSPCCGVYDWDLPAVAAAKRNQRIQQHFYGVPRGVSLIPLREEIPFGQIDVARWTESDGQPTLQRIPESQYRLQCDKRIGSIYRSTDVVQSSPMLCPCHVVSVEASAIVVFVSSHNIRGQTKLFLVVGFISWLGNAGS